MHRTKRHNSKLENAFIQSLHTVTEVDIAQVKTVLQDIDEFNLHRFSPREVIYHQGDASDMVYLIHSGLVKLLSHLPNGRARIVRLNVRGQWIGLEGLVDKHYSHHAVAYDEVEVFAVPKNSIKQIRRKAPHVYCNFLEHSYGHLRQADQWIAGFSTGCIKSRVVNLIEHLARLEYGEASDTVTLLTVSEMGEILGVTPESVSRILAEFKRNNILHRQSTPRETYQFESHRLQQEARP